jgi:DNA-binding SARP family transcriptional activator
VGCPATTAPEWVRRHRAAFDAREVCEHQRQGVIVALPGRAIAVARREQGRPVELHLLGGFRLTVGGAPVVIGPTGQRLLALLACRGRQVSKAAIAHVLWPHKTSTRAQATLRTALYRLGRACPAAVVHTTDTTVQLAIGIWVDLEQSVRLANRVLNDAITMEVLAAALASNLNDDLLPDWDDEWLAGHQYRYRQLRLATLETLSHWLATTAQQSTATHAAVLRDSTHATLTRACLAQGNHHDAVTHYAAYRRVLREQLDVESPSGDRSRLLVI